MRHAVLAPTKRDAVRLANRVIAEGWFARIVNAKGHIGVIVHAPECVLNQACRAVSFEPGRTLGAS